MSNTIILYRSKYGTTYKYAQWLREALCCDLKEIKKVRTNDLTRYDTVIIGGGIYIGNIAGIAFLHKNINVLKNKNLAVFAVGVSGTDEENLKNLKQRNLKEVNIPLFYLQGAIDMDKLSFLDRTLCKMVSRDISQKPPETREAWEKSLLQAADGCGQIDKAQLGPIINYVMNIDSAKSSSYNK